MLAAPRRVARGEEVAAVLDILKLAALFAGIIAMTAAPVLLAVRLESRRQRRGIQQLAASLEEPVVEAAAAPGAWALARVRGRRAGCAVALEPEVSGHAIAVGGARMRSMGVVLTVTGARSLGEGTWRCRDGAQVAEGALAPLPAAAQAALVARRAGPLTVRGDTVRARFLLPLRRAAIDEMQAIVDALGPSLRG